MIGSGFNDVCGVMTPLQAQAIDTKIDDGIANTGNFNGYKGWNHTVDCRESGNFGAYLKTDTLSCNAFYVLK